MDRVKRVWSIVVSSIWKLFSPYCRLHGGAGYGYCCPTCHYPGPDVALRFYGRYDVENSMAEMATPAPSRFINPLGTFVDRMMIPVRDDLPNGDNDPTSVYLDGGMTLVPSGIWDNSYNPNKTFVEKRMNPTPSGILGSLGACTEVYADGLVMAGPSGTPNRVNSVKDLMDGIGLPGRSSILSSRGIYKVNLPRPGETLDVIESSDESSF